jgi:hypothetical protein
MTDVFVKQDGSQHETQFNKAEASSSGQKICIETKTYISERECTAHTPPIPRVKRFYYFLHTHCVANVMFVGFNLASNWLVWCLDIAAQYSPYV